MAKKDIEIQPGFEPGSRSDALPMSYWSSGIGVVSSPDPPSTLQEEGGSGDETSIGAEDRWHLSTDTVRFSGWISYRLGDLCMISSKVPK